jgi:hypothetical protein
MKLIALITKISNTAESFKEKRSLDLDLDLSLSLSLSDV